MSKFEERFSRINELNAQIKPLRLTPYNYDIKYRKEAIKCLYEHLPISCIVVSSALVEACLKWEHFRRKPEEERKVIRLEEFRQDTLGCLFKEFEDSDVPLGELLDTGDIEDLRNGEKKINQVKYILTRNKFAHGDVFYQIVAPCGLISGYEQDWEDYGIDDYNEWLEATLETVAYVHLLKTLRFMKAFTDLMVKKIGKLKG